MRNGGAAHNKIEAPQNFDSISHRRQRKRSPQSLWHYGQYHIGTGRETTPWYYLFLLSHIHRLSVCKEDFSLTLEMTIRESY